MLIKPCPVCGNNIPARFSSIPKGKNPQRVQCGLCQLIFFPGKNYPRPVYDLKYNLHFFRPGDIRKAGIMAEKIAELAKKHFQYLKILEIGPGNGLTSFLVQQLGYNIDAVDLDPKLCSFLANKYTLNIYCKDFETTNFNWEYNIIYASHVIEHSMEPLKFLRKAHKTLTEKGILFIDTPDGDKVKPNPKTWKHFSTRHRYEHCCIFTPETMKIAAEKAGFKKVHLIESPKFQSFQAYLYK